MISFIPRASQQFLAAGRRMADDFSRRAPAIHDRKIVPVLNY